MTTLSIQTETAKGAITMLLDDLPPESLPVVRQFIEFLRQQAQQGRSVVTTPSTTGEPKAPYLYPTITVPASSLEAWGKLLDEGYEGDALADTESLYDKD
ncbi:MAG: hypothetical protein WHX52_02760 [Anaerolineae bacterium]